MFTARGPQCGGGRGASPRAQGRARPGLPGGKGQEAGAAGPAPPLLSMDSSADSRKRVDGQLLLRETPLRPHPSTWKAVGSEVSPEGTPCLGKHHVRRCHHGCLSPSPLSSEAQFGITFPSILEKCKVMVRRAPDTIRELFLPGCEPFRGLRGPSASSLNESALGLAVHSGGAYHVLNPGLDHGRCKTE